MTHYTLKNLQTTPPPVLTKLHNELAAKGTLGIVFGDPRSGKSTWIRHFCSEISASNKIVFLNTADHPTVVKDSFNSLGYKFTDDQLENINILDASGINYSDYDSLIAELDEIHEEGNIDLLVVDEAEQYVSRYDHQGAKHYLEKHAWRLFRKLIDRYGCALEAVCRQKLAEELSFDAHCVRKIYAKHSDDRMLPEALRHDLSRVSLAYETYKFTDNEDKKHVVDKNTIFWKRVTSDFPQNGRLCVWQRDISDSVTDTIYAYTIDKGAMDNSINLFYYGKADTELQS